MHRIVTFRHKTATDLSVHLICPSFIKQFFIRFNVIKTMYFLLLGLVCILGSETKGISVQTVVQGEFEVQTEFPLVLTDFLVGISQLVDTPFVIADVTDTFIRIRMTSASTDKIQITEIVFIVFTFHRYTKVTLIGTIFCST